MESRDRIGRQRGRARTVLLVLVALVGAYFATMHFVRRHVDGKIAATQGHKLPAFDLPLVVGGGRIASADLRGKHVVVNFFRSRCHSCDAESAAVRAFAAQVRERSDVVVLSVLLDGVLAFAPTETSATLARHAYLHPVAFADRAFLEAFHGVGWASVTPITYVTDREHTIRAALRGTQTLDSLTLALRSAGS